MGLHTWTQAPSLLPLVHPVLSTHRAKPHREDPANSDLSPEQGGIQTEAICISSWIFLPSQRISKAYLGLPGYCMSVLILSDMEPRSSCGRRHTGHLSCAREWERRQCDLDGGGGCCGHRFRSTRNFLHRHICVRFHVASLGREFRG